MSDNNWYWNGSLFPNSGGTTIPTQTVSRKKKNKDYLKRTTDSLEAIGMRQISENLRFRDFYRMIEGKMSYVELQEAAPQLSELSDIMEDLELDNQIEHFDIIGIPINALIGEYMREADKFSVTNMDTISTSEYQRERNELLNEHIREKIQKEIKVKLIKRGLDPDISPDKFQSEEEYNAYLEHISQVSETLTPDSIDSYMSKDWKSKGVLWGQATLKKDRDRFEFRELYRQLFKDYLGTGRCFLHYLVSGDYYKPERWSPLNTFFSQEVDNRFPQHGEYIGRIHKFSRAEIFKRYGNKLSKIEKEKLNNSYSSFSDGMIFPTPSFSGNHLMNAPKGTDDIFITPHKNFFDYNYMLGIQDELGVPVAEKTTVNNEGQEVTYPVFLPQRAVQDYTRYGIGEILTDNYNLRKDLIQVTEVYFTSYEEIGYLRYRTESGLLVSEIVTKDINKEFLKYYNIKGISSLSLTESLHKYKGENIIIWDYIPKIYKAVKISNNGTQLSEPIYLDLDENEFQLKGDSNKWDFRLPVAGLNAACMVDKMLPYQKNHNIAMNEIKSLLQKELGVFWMFDVKMLPSDLKGWGDTEETLLAISDIVKDTGLFPLDMSRHNLQGGTSFNQFVPQNMSLSAQISDRLTLAERYKWMAYEQFGINPNRLGAPSTYETKEGIQIGQQAQYAQTEDIFETFNSFKKKSLEMHLAVAQYAQSNNKDFTFLYTSDDGNQELLELHDPDMPFRTLGISINSSSREKEDLQLFKSAILNNNTLGADITAIAEAITSDSVQAALSVGRTAYERELQKLQEQREVRQREIESQSKTELEKKQMEIDADNENKRAEREKDVLVAQIHATGRASDKNSDMDGFREIRENAKLALDRINKDRSANIAEESNRIRREDSNKRHSLEEEKIKLKERELNLKEKAIDTHKYTSEINKN